MWIQLFLFVAYALTSAQGMCFGVPNKQQSTMCPGRMVYSKELCICIDTQINIRVHDNVASRQSYHPFDPIQIFKQRLLALNHHLATGLQDTESLRYASSKAGVPSTPDNSVPSYSSMSLNPIWLSDNKIKAKEHPSMWGKSGSLGEYKGPRIPSLSSNQQQILGMAEQMRPLPLIESLEPLRKTWKASAIQRARKRFGNQALAKKFFGHATQGVSPDEALVLKNQMSNGVAPDSLNNRNFYKAPKKTVKSLLDLKRAVLMKRGLENRLPQRAVRWANRFMM